MNLCDLGASLQQFRKMEEAPQTDTPAPEATTPMDVENQEAITEVAEETTSEQESQVVRTLFLKCCIHISNFYAYIL